MNKTIRELFVAYKGEETTCPETTTMLDAEYPGWTLDTVVDVKEYLDHHITHGIEEFATVAIFKNLNIGQRQKVLVWARGLLSGETGMNKEKLDMVKFRTDERALRAANKLLTVHGKSNPTEILTKCMEALGLV